VNLSLFVPAPLHRSITIHGPGEFTGEDNMISDCRATYRVRVIKPGKVIELNRQNMMALIE